MMMSWRCCSRIVAVVLSPSLVLLAVACTVTAETSSIPVASRPEAEDETSTQLLPLFASSAGGDDDDDDHDDGTIERIRAAGVRGQRDLLTSSSDGRLLLVTPEYDGNYDDSTTTSGIVINMMRRAKDHVSPTDVPFLLQIPPHDITSASEAMYNIFTECYGLVGQRYDDDNVEILMEDRRNNIVDRYFLSADDDTQQSETTTAKRQLQQRREPDQSQHGQQPFHFIATHHYQEGAALFTPKHRGRIIAILEHPVTIVQKNFLASVSSASSITTSLSSSSTHQRRQQQQQQQQHDALLEQLIQYINSTDYIDNTMTRMISNIPHPTPLTEEHFKYARMILENKFLIGMGYDMDETLYKRIKLYFGWNELKNKRGCEAKIMKSLPIITSSSHKSSSSSSPATTLSSLVEEGSKIWRFIQRKNLFDMKLYARGMSVFADQKMRLPVHSSVRSREVEVVQNAFFDGGNLRNVDEVVRDASSSDDIPFFWHIPKASGTTVKEILSDCYGLIRTEMIQPPSSLEVFHDKHVLNVDLSTPESIILAIKDKVADRGLADVFISQLSLEGSTIFSNSYHMGRAFTILRHPVKLAASLFYYRRIATWEPTYRPEYNNITLLEYVETNGYYDNWMVRMLSNAKLGGLNDSHLELAKRILKEKFVIGISDHMDETFRMLQVYFGWVETRGGCVNYHLHSAPSNKNKYPIPENGGPLWAMIAEKNKYDMALYYYALELFGDQSEKLIFREG